MSDDRAYRVHIVYDGEQERFVARAYELDAQGTGETRAEAVAALESEMESKVEQAAVEAGSLPAPTDLSGQSSELTLRLSELVTRDLRHLARKARLSVDQLAVQLLSRAAAVSLGAPQLPVEAPARAEGARDRERDSRPPAKENRGGGGRGRGRRGRQEGYRPDMDDQANFLAYVRDMEKGGGRRR